MIERGYKLQWVRGDIGDILYGYGAGVHAANKWQAPHFEATAVKARTKEQCPLFGA